MISKSWNVKGTIGTLCTTGIFGYALYHGVKWYLKKLANAKKPKTISRSDKTIPESKIPGSELMPANRTQLPSSQVRMAIKTPDGKAYEVVGGGVRIDEFLVAPKHNFFSPTSELYVLDRDDKPHLITGNVYDLAADMSAVLIKDWSLLKVAKTSLTPNTAVSTVSAMSSVDFRYSVGGLKTRELIGRVEYTGSTAPGFSGSPYMNGHRCAGIHVHGGSINGGYDAMYIWCRLKHHIFTLDEDDMGIVKEAVKSSYRLNDEGSDAQAEKEEILIYEEVGMSKSGEAMAVGRAKGGKYIYAKAKTFERLKELQQNRAFDYKTVKEDNWADDADDDEEYRELQDNIRTSRYEPECLVGPQGARFQGESQRQAVRGAPCQDQSKSQQDSASSNGEAPQRVAKPVRVIQRFAALSYAQQRRLMASFENSKPQKKTTAPRTQAQGQSGQASLPNSQQQQN